MDWVTDPEQYDDPGMTLLDIMIWNDCDLCGMNSYLFERSFFGVDSMERSDNET